MIFKVADHIEEESGLMKALIIIFFFFFERFHLSPSLVLSDPEIRKVI